MNHKTYIAIILCLFIVQITIAQQPGEISYQDESVMPAGKMGGRIQSLIDTLNSHNSDRIRRFLEEECTERFRKVAPMDTHIDMFFNLNDRWGKVKFHSIRTYVPPRKNQTVVILKDSNFDSWRAFTIRFVDQENYIIAGIRFNEARTPSNVTESALTEKQFLEEVQNLVNRLSKNDVISGTLLIAKGKKVLLTHSCGEASKRFHVPNNIDTKFNLGSMNKMFTSVSILQLTEKGKLSLQDTIDKYVDESWLPKDTTSKITIHHLLTHSSGLGSYFNDVYDKGSRLRWRAVNDYKDLIKVEKLAFEPGKRFRYSNTGMFILGVVIESVTGETYFDYVRKNIAEPAGMKNTDCYEMDYPVENLAIGYSRDRQSPWGWQNNIYKHVVKGGPAGGGFSTVKDLHRFALALQAEKLVSKESLEKLWTDHLDAGYGYGFIIEEGANGKVVGHGGGFSGINSNLDIYLEKGYIVAVMSNYDRGASPVAGRIKQLLARVK